MSSATVTANMQTAWISVPQAVAQVTEEDGDDTLLLAVTLPLMIIFSFSVSCGILYSMPYLARYHRTQKLGQVRSGSVLDLQRISTPPGQQITKVPRALHG